MGWFSRVMTMPSISCWFAIQVRPNCERTVEATLRYKGYEVYLPTYRYTRRWSDRVKTSEVPLFAGYLFCQFSPAASAPIVTTHGVVRILGVGSSPVAIEETEIKSLRAVESCDGLRFYPWPRLEVGAQVCIRTGPLQGLVGVLRQVKNKCTFILAVPLLQRSVAVEIPAACVAPAKTTRPLVAASRGA